MYLVYNYNPYGEDELVGYVNNEKEFIEFCETLGLQKIQMNRYGKPMGYGYYKDVHYIKEINKCV